MSPNEVLTTGQISKLCGVAPRTVSKWFDNRTLRGYRIPGSQDRRVPVCTLHRFLLQSGMSDAAERLLDRVLVLSNDEDLIGKIELQLANEPLLSFEVVRNTFSLGHAIAKAPASLIVIDASTSSWCVETVCQALVQGVPNRRTRLLLILSEEQTLSSNMTNCFDEVFRAPFDIDLLVLRISSLLGRSTEERLV